MCIEKAADSVGICDTAGCGGFVINNSCYKSHTHPIIRAECIKQTQRWGLLSSEASTPGPGQTGTRAKSGLYDGDNATRVVKSFQAASRWFSCVPLFSFGEFCYAHRLFSFSFCLYSRHSVQPHTRRSAPPRGRRALRSAAHVAPQPAAILCPTCASRLAQLPHCCHHVERRHKKPFPQVGWSAAKVLPVAM